MSKLSCTFVVWASSTGTNDVVSEEGLVIIFTKYAAHIPYNHDSEHAAGLLHSLMQYHGI